MLAKQFAARFQVQVLRRRLVLHLFRMGQASLFWTAKILDCHILVHSLDCNICRFVSL